MEKFPNKKKNEQISFFFIPIALASFRRFKMPTFVVQLRRCRDPHCARFALNPSYPHCCGVCRDRRRINGRRHTLECNFREGLVQRIMIHFGEQLREEDEENVVEAHEAAVDDW